MLFRSKVWLVPKTGVTTPDPDTQTDWIWLQEDTGLLTLAAGSQVIIRICGAKTVSNYLGKMSVVISRDARRASLGPDQKPYQTHASPFPSSPGGSQSLVMYHTPAWQPPVTAAGSWWWNLGSATIVTAPPDPPPAAIHDSYGVIAAITTGPAGAGIDPHAPGALPTYYLTYSHDPDMDVNC